MLTVMVYNGKTIYNGLMWWLMALISDNGQWQWLRMLDTGWYKLLTMDQNGEWKGW